MEEKNIKATKNELDLAKAFVGELFEKLEIKAETSFSLDETSGAILLDVQNETEKGLLIGPRGETLNSLSQAVKSVLKNETGNWYNVVVNIGDWRAKQEDYLKDLVEKAISRLNAGGEAQTLYNLNASQRRMVHLLVSEHEELQSHSEGEGVNRCLIISKK